MDESTEDDSHWTSEENEGEPVGGSRWHAGQTSFILSAERLTTISGWSTTETVPTTTFPGPSGSSATSSEDFERSGTDVSFLGAGLSRNLYAIPRLSLDGRFSNGFTIGGSLSYIVQSGKHDTAGTASGSKMSVDDPTATYFLFAPRVGVMFEASPTVSVWLRGGITRVSASLEDTGTNPNTGASTSASETLTVLAVTADPQLVFTPIPHVGILLGATLDIGASGTDETNFGGTSESHDYKASSYGVNAGLAALF